MASQYSSFLRSPTTSVLAADASLVYITTTTEIREPNAILKHLQAQQKHLEKKEEKILNAIESQDGLCLETETTILFKTGGGVYLPNVDENLLDERTVTFPLLHVVRFDADKKIKQIRLYWDQGTLLKQVDAIGRSGKNWPIRDGSSQIDAINKSLNAGGRSTNMNGTASVPARSAHDGVTSDHNKRSSLSATRDPHASLDLFQKRDPNADAAPRAFDGPTVKPRETAKPQSRDLGQILSGEEMAPAPGSNVRSPSPTKEFNAKSGAGKHHVNNRLFDENEAPTGVNSPERKKTYNQKYDHFTFGNGEDAPAEARPKSGKGGGKYNQQSSFDFQDFSTPPKVTEKARPDYERHWGAGVEEDDPPSPAKRPIVHAPRPNLESHFQFSDSSPAATTTNTSSNNNGQATKSFQRQKGMGLYQDPLHDDTRTAISKASHRRGNDFDIDAHYTLTDTSTPEKEKERKIYKTAGDGMGGRKATGRSWGFGDESDPEVDADVRPSARSRPGRGGRTAAQAEAGAGQF